MLERLNDRRHDIVRHQDLHLFHIWKTKWRDNLNTACEYLHSNKIGKTASNSADKGLTRSSMWNLELGIFRSAIKDTFLRQRADTVWRHTSSHAFWNAGFEITSNFNLKKNFFFSKRKCWEATGLYYTPDPVLLSHGFLWVSGAEFRFAWNNSRILGSEYLVL